MKNRSTILALLWLFIFCSHHVMGTPGSDRARDGLDASELSAALFAPPAAGFTYVANGGCVPVTVQFYSQLGGPAYAWTFGDGGTSTDCNPVHTYTLPGTYTVTLVATGGTYTTTITVGANPVVTFTGDSVSCQNAVKNYTITSTIPPASWSWQAQGGTVTSSTATTATVTWTSYGVNYLNYTITTAAGCTKIFRYKVKVIPPPQVNLPCCEKRDKPGNPDGTVNPEEGVNGGSEPCSACAGSYNCYTATINPEFGTSSDYTWSWTATNGTIVSISNDSTKACIVWGASGTGTITLVMTHKIYGCQTTKKCEVTINPGVTPAFTVSGNCINSPVYFDATGTTPLSDVASFYWEFGDGYTATTTTPFANHQFTFTGTYTATLTITTKKGCVYKTTVTFNVISGTKPEIVCPGTACEGSRQCYSTQLIAGATYAWTVTGAVPGTVNVNNNEVCVTWGAGPVGTVTVTVTGGGYTCTNSATEAVSIVSATIPVNGPDYICNNTSFIEVSTANYAGACYRWTINGVPQASQIYKLQFNPMSYGSPITVAVDVDFPLGCCHGSGTKVITKLPQYTMNFYNNNTCVGHTVTYSLLFPAGPPSSPVAWSVDGGTITSFTASSVTVNWTTAGTGTITAGNNSPTQYCNDASNNSWNVTVWAPATGDDISGPPVVCAGTANTYYHAWASPTASASVSVAPSAGVSIAAGPYSSGITFPAVAVPTNYTISVTYNHSMISPCGTTKTYVVKVMPNTVPAFSGTGGVICQGDIVTYTANLPDTINYDWNVIGGSVLSESYSSPTLTIQVQWNSTVTSSLNIINKVCGLTGSQPITVNGKPVVIISSTQPSCTGPAGVTLSVAPVWATYSWAGGPATPSWFVNTVGPKTITVSNGVCSNSGTYNVSLVSPTPPTITGFTVTPAPYNLCPKYNTICPSISPGSGSITSYSWSFTGFTAGSSTASCPAVALSTWPGPATGTWTLTVTDSYGCQSTLSGSLTDSCVIDTGVTPPCTSVATFSITYNPCTGQFTETGTNYTSVLYYFGDGTLASGSNPVHFYSTACNKTVTCYVTDTAGCTKTFTTTIAVPYAFGMPLTVTATNSVCTGASSITASGISLCGGTASYAWTITPAAGGPPVYTVTNASATLNVGTIGAIPPGNFNVSVVMTASGCSKTATGSFNKGGLRAFFVSCGGCAGSPLTFLDQSLQYTAPLIKWQWNITGPATFNSFLQNPTINFTVPGTYSVTLTVWDNNPCSHSYTTSIVIQPPFVPGNIMVNNVATASGTSFDICPGAPYVLKAPPGGVSWSWSDGSNLDSLVVTEPGDYYVTVFNALNCAAKVGPIKFRYKPAPEAIIVSGSLACSPMLLRAFAGTGYSYLWNYPVSNTSTFPYIYHTVSGPVSLTVTNLHGCSATTTQNITVFPSPFVSISYAPMPYCPGNTVTLTANTSGGTAPYSHLWNNGNLTSSISVSQPGLYEHWVTDANGCPAKDQLNLQPAIPSGMDLLPKGCYTICGQSVTFCTGTMPFGWTGQWYLGASPYGGVIPQGGNMATTFTMSGTYTLHYIPVNPAVSCPAVSAPVTITFTSLPTFTITTVPSPPIICTGSGIGVVLTVDIQLPIYNYTWYLGATVVGTGYSYTAMTAGTYTLVISKGECCKTSVRVTVIERPCCFENPNVPYTPILVPTNITSNTFWFDKLYIDALVTVSGSAILDITNVDCVFGPNGSIRMEDQSFLRCNNSVLRPCEKDDIWQGIDFRDQSSGWINTTTIKNAIIAVDILSNPVGVRLTDNSFIKCQIGVNIDQSWDQQSISGNSFETDESQLPYPSTPNEYWGIKLYNTDMNGLISQNTFRHVQPENTSNIYYGIYAEYSHFTASENHFDDMYRAIDVTGNQDVVAIEKNEMKLNHMKQSYDRYQVRVTNCDQPVLIYENVMDNGLGDVSTAGAIYCEHTYRTHIKDNRINGFWHGVDAIATGDLHVTSNEVTSSTNFGISLMQTSRSVISCNTINGMNTNFYTRFGILDLDGDGSSYIYSNCIFNMNTAMYFRAINNAFNLPQIYNNYMYNYDQTGIFNVNYNGTIGNGGGPLAAGRNTFMSNNGAVGTQDIFSIPPINEGGNFGVLFTTGVTSVTGPDEFYSTAACGHQIERTYPSNQLDQYNACDIYFLDKWVYKTDKGEYRLRQPDGALTIGTINEALKENRNEVLGQAAAMMLKGGNDATETANTLLSSNIDRNLAARMITSAYVSMREPKTAAAFLTSPALSGMSPELRKTLDIQVQIAMNPEMTESQRAVLTGIDNMDNLFSPIARDIIQGQAGEHDYKFRRIGSPETDRDQKAGNPVSRASNYIAVYPVPASQQISVQHNVKDAAVQALKVYSASGVEVTNFKYTAQAGTINIDISTLPSGVYSVLLLTDNQSASMMTGRFIKVQ